MDINEATELDLMTAWLKKMRNRSDLSLTRLGRTEIRHVCLYASQALSEMRTEVLKNDYHSGYAILELREVISQLESLVNYLEEKGGAFSALIDRNKKVE